MEKNIKNQEDKDIKSEKVEEQIENKNVESKSEDKKKSDAKTKETKSSKKSTKTTKIKKTKDSDKETSKQVAKLEKELTQKEEELTKLEEANKTLNDKFLRIQAEFDNYKKRTIKEKMDLVKSGGENVLKDLLPILDDLDLAIEHIDKAKDIESLKTGIQLIQNKFKTFIQSKGLSEVEALHKEFDTDNHEALTKIPVEDKKLKGKIVEVLQKGYKLNDKVIRFAKVVIGE